MKKQSSSSSSPSYLAQIPARYIKRMRRRNAPGWEGVNLALLARDLGVSGQYLRDVLCGRREGSVRLVERVAERLGLEFGQVVRGIGRGMRELKRLEQERDEVVGRLERGMRLRGLRDKVGE